MTRPTAAVLAAIAGLACLTDARATTDEAPSADNAVVLSTIAPRAFATGPDATIEIETGGRAFTLIPARSETNTATGGRVLTGGLAGAPGRFVLAEVNGKVAGAIWTDDAAFEIRPAGPGGLVRVTDIDTADLPGCATVGHRAPFDAVDPGLAGDGSDAATRGTPEEITRVLVAITAAGEAQMGGPDAAIAVALAAIASANTAYDNSLMTVGDDGLVACRLELAGTLTVDPGTGLGAGGLLGALRSTDDGVMDEVHTLRDATGADLVALLSESGIGACGVAYLAPTNPSLGFSVTAQNCAVGNLTFAHELGHNQGASHDADNAGNGYRPYGFGWRWTTTGGQLRRSVMAYSPGSRRPHFSNPEVLNGGGATGDASVADNARLIGETFPIIAAHRTGTGNGVGDCDGDGTPDLLQILDDPALDSDASGVLDSCELDAGLLDDCNNDGIADISQVSPRVLRTPDAVWLAGFPPYETTMADLAPALTDVTLTLTADSDLSGPNEYLDIAANGVPLGRFWENDGADCDPSVTTATLTFTPQEFASFGPDLTITVTRSTNVGVQCSSDAVQVTLEYNAANPALDANGNGVIDSCEPNCNAADLAEPFGTLDLADIGAFVTAFTAQQPAGDVNNDGVWDLGDIGVFVGAFNAGCP
jgi:hypothetical protein